MATITAHYANAALHGARRLQYDVTAILADAALDAAILEQRGKRVTDAELTRLVQCIWQALGDEFMGCTEHGCKRGAFAMMCQLASHTQSLDAAFEQGLRFYALLTDDIQMHYRKYKDTRELEVSMRAPALDKEHFFQEFWLVIWHRFMSWLCGEQIKLQGAYFDYPRPAHADEFTYQFNGPCYFEQPQTKLVFAKHYGGLAPIRTQREIAQFIKESPALLMTIPGSDGSYTRQVKQLLDAELAQKRRCPSLREICQSLPLSEQTLRRKLQEEGLSFNAIRNALLRDRAIEKLLVQRLSLVDTASQLGFTEPSSFIRAFKRWTGETPQSYLRSRAR